MQRRIDELDTHLSKGFAILDLPRELGKSVQQLFLDS